MGRNREITEDEFLCADAMARESVNDPSKETHAAVFIARVYLQLREISKLIESLPDHEIVEVYAVHDIDSRNPDEPGPPRWFFLEHEDAKHLSEDHSFFECQDDATITRHFAIMVRECSYLLSTNQPIDINAGPEEQERRRESALAKLTWRDKQALGLV